MECNPLVSVVTVSYNAVSTIEETILSIINQTYPRLEYIIIDGGSTDGTVDIIKKYADKIACWLSEPDDGIFHAMNKGISLANGEWINFMNSGDTFHSLEIVTTVVNNMKDGVDIIYGDVIAAKKNGDVFMKSAIISTILRNMPFCHQSSFIKTKILKESCFDLKYELCADYDNFYKAYKAGKIFLRLPLVIADFEATDGVSSKHINKLKKEICFITGRSKIMVHLEYFIRNMKYTLMKYLK